MFLDFELCFGFKKKNKYFTFTQNVIKILSKVILYNLILQLHFEQHLSFGQTLK